MIPTEKRPGIWSRESFPLFSESSRASGLKNCPLHPIPQLFPGYAVGPLLKREVFTVETQVVQKIPTISKKLVSGVGVWQPNFGSVSLTLQHSRFCRRDAPFSMVWQDIRPFCPWSVLCGGRGG